MKITREKGSITMEYYKDRITIFNKIYVILEYFFIFENNEVFFF